MDTSCGLGNGIGGFSRSTETRHGRKGPAGRDRDSDVFGGSWNHLRGQTGNVNALSLILIGSWDDLVDCQYIFCRILGDANVY